MQPQTPQYPAQPAPAAQHPAPEQPAQQPPAPQYLAQQQTPMQPPSFPQDAPEYAQHSAYQPPLLAPVPRNPAIAAYIRAVFSSRGMVTVAWIAGVVLAAGLLGAILLLTAAANASGAGSSDLGDSVGLGADFGQVISGLLVALGVAFGGGIAVDANVDAGLFEASGRASLGVVPLGVIAAVVVGSAIAARLRMRQDRVLAPTLGAEIVRAAIEGGLVALAMTVLTAFASLGGSAEFGGVELRSRAGLVFVTVFVAVTAALFLARTDLRRRVSGAVDGQWTASLRETGLALAVQFAAFGAAGIALLVISSVQAESAAPLLAGLPLLGNIAVAGAALGQLGGISAGAGSLGGISFTAFDLPDGRGWWTIVIAVLGLVVAAVAVGLRRRRTAQPAWGRTWQMPLMVFAVWCVLALGAAGVTAQGEVLSALDFGGSGSIGLTWPVPFLAGVGAALVSVGAEFLPLLVYRMNPALLAAFGGRRAVQAWISGVGLAGAPAAGPVAPAANAPATAGAFGAPQPAAPFADAAGGAQEPWQAVSHAPNATATPDGTIPTEQLPEFGGAAPLAAGPHDSARFGQAPQGLGQGLPEPAPMSRKAKGGLIIGLSAVGLIVLLVAGAAITVTMLNQGRDPAGAVGKYLALLESGKAEGATKLVDPGIQNADRELLTDEVLGAAEHRIEVESVETTSRTETGARVHAVYSLDGERFDVDLAVVRGPKEFLFLDTWRLEEPLLVPATLSGDGVTALLVGETEVALEGGEAGGHATREVYVYPGVYSVTGQANEYVSASEEELRAAVSTISGPAYAEVSVQPNQKFEDAVLKQVQSRITRCIEIPTNMDDVCPYVTRDKDLAEMKVVSQAEGFESIDLSRFEASRATIAVRQNPSSWDKDPELRESDVTVTGEVEIVDGKPVVTELWMSSW